MSVDFTAIPDPTYFFGNSQDIHQALLDNLRTLTDAVNDGNDNATDLATKQYVRNKNEQMRTNDNSVSASKQWTNRNDYDNTGGGCSIHLKSGTTQFVESGCSVHFGSGGVLDMGTGSTLTTPNTTISTTEIDALDGISSNIQTQLNGKQATITGTTDLTMQDLTCRNITCQAGTIQYSEITLNDGALTIAKTSGLQTALDSKQATITDGSIADAKLASTFVKPSTAPTLTGTNFTGIPESAVTNLTSDLASKQATISGTTDLTTGSITLGTGKTFEGKSKTTISYLDATSSIQTQLDSKISTIADGSIGDAKLASTFVKPSTAPTLTGTNFTGIPESAVTNLTSDLAAKQASISGTTDLTTGSITLGTGKTFEGKSKTTISYLDATSSIQTQLDSKISTIADGSIGDAKLASTFVKPSTAPTLTGTNFTGIPESAVTNLTSDLASKQASISGTTDLTTGSITLGTGKTFEGKSKTTISYLDATSSIQTQLDGKQATITNGSIADNKLASTFLKASDIPTTLSYLDATSSIQTQIDNISAGAIPDGSITDAKLASTFVKPSTDFTAGSITLGTGKTFEGISKATIAYLDPTSSIQTQLNGKQATITNGSIADNKLASTFLKASDIPTTLSYLDPTSSVQTQLNGKQATIDGTTDLTTGSITLGTGKTFEGISKATIAYLDPTSSVQTQLNGKQATIDGTTDLTTGSITLGTGKTLEGISKATIAYLDPTSSVQTQLNGKQATITNGSIADNKLASTFLKSSDIPTTLSYLDATSSVQSQLNGKQATIGGTTDLTTGSIALGTGKTFEGISKATIAFVDPTSSIQTQLDGKQASLGSGSVSDSMLASTFVKTSTDQTIAGIKTFSSAPVISGASISSGTIADASLASTFVKTSTDQTIAGIKTFSSAPVLSGASISSGTIPDSALVTTTFVKSSTAPTLTGTNFTGIPTSAISSGALTITSLTCTSETDSGNATFGSLSEKFTSIGNNGTTNSYTLDYTGNTAVYILSTAPTANMTIRLNNCGTDTTKSINFAIIYNTTGKWYGSTVTAYSDTSTQITLASSTPLYASGTPTLTSSTVIVQSFSLIRNFASSYVLSSIVSYY